MNRTYILALLSGMACTTPLHTFDDEFFKDIDRSFHRMNKRVSSSVLDKNALHKTIESMQKHMETMREQFEKIQEDILQQHESERASSAQQLYTINDEKEMLTITVDVGTIETESINNHIEKNNLIITLPSDKPSLKIVVTPDMLIISGKKVEEKQQKTDDAASHVFAARTVHVQQILPATVVPTENVSITHNADEKALIIEIPKKINTPKFTIKKK